MIQETLWWDECFAPSKDSFYKCSCLTLKQNFKKKKKKEKCPMHSYKILLVCDWNSLHVEKGNIFYNASSAVSVD